MSKKKAETTETQQPAFVEELLKNGTTVLTAKTRDELAEMVDNIPADVRYAVGAVGRKQDGSAYTLRVDIIKI
jgi:hypothetical protein